MFVQTSCLWQFISRLTQIRLYSQRYQFELRLKTSALHKKKQKAGNMWVAKLPGLMKLLLRWQKIRRTYLPLEYAHDVLSRSYFSSVNKRLDEWVPEERMDISKMEYGKKDVKTPKKEIGKHGTGSRPASPELPLVVR